MPTVAVPTMRTASARRRRCGHRPFHTTIIYLLSVLLIAAPLRALAHGPDGEHTCIHDEIVREQQQGSPEVSFLAETTTVTSAAALRNRAAPAPAVTNGEVTFTTDAPPSPSSGLTRSFVGPVRITVVRNDLDDPNKRCTAAGQTLSDMRGNHVVCTAADILDNATLGLAVTAVRHAVHMHYDRLQTQQLSNIRVSYFSMSQISVCKNFYNRGWLAISDFADTEYVLYLAAAPTSGTNIAWATPCLYADGSGRPVVGVVNISPRYISGSDFTMRVLTHEIMHALGFIATAFSSRGMLAQASARGKPVQYGAVSSNVLSAAQLHFGCPELRFYELEDEGGAGTANSHWKMRNALHDLMSGYANALRYSAITIAAMEDLGYYIGNYENAETMTYGAGLGCDFFTNLCINSVTKASAFPSAFCDHSSKGSMCDSARMAIGTCGIVTWLSALPSYAQYFGSAVLGGRNAGMDYCPFVASTSDATRCEGGDPAAMPGSALGSSARCLSAAAGGTLTVRASGTAAAATVPAVCAEVQCVRGLDGGSYYRVRLAGASDFVVCEPGRTLSPATLSRNVFSAGTISCPPYAEVCGGLAVVPQASLTSTTKEPTTTTPAPVVTTTRAPATPVPTTTTTTTAKPATTTTTKEPTTTTTTTAKPATTTTTKEPTTTTTTTKEPTTTTTTTKEPTTQRPTTTTTSKVPAATTTTTKKPTTTTTTTAPTGGNGQWQALSGDPSNYVAFDCDSNGTRWRQHNRCTGASPAASPTRCYGDHVSAPTGPGASEAANSTAAEGYEPCAVSRCAGWSCSGGGLLVQRYTPEAPQPPMARNTLATLDPCYCAAARAADGRPDTAAGAVAGRGRLTVAPGGSGYRADHPTCAAAGLRCADASHNLRLRLENCYCCPHRDEPQFFSTILPCVAPIRG